LQGLLAGRRGADNSTVIAGAMPKWRQYFHRFAGGFMCVWFAGLGVYSARTPFAAGTRPEKARIIVSLIFMALATSAIVAQFWFQRRIVCEFTYDGSTLQFRTLGISQTQMRPLEDIAQVKEWRGRGGPIGYRLVFQDGAKAYLEHSVANSVALVDQLRRDARG
jgi:hypothetical protein